MQRLISIGVLFLIKQSKQMRFTFLFFLLLPGVVLAQTTSQIDAEKKLADAEEDLIRLESRFIGDKEQPSVTYFVPWQGTDSPDDLRWKIERKNDDTLNLVDRDIMLRSMNIYNEMNLETTD